MTNFRLTAFMDFDARLHEHSIEMEALRAALDIQSKRIAQMQAELDILPQARKRRELLRALLNQRTARTPPRVL